MKNLHKLEFLGLFDNFCVKLKLFFKSETGANPIKKPTGERLQLLNRFRVLIHEKLRWKIQKCKNVKNVKKSFYKSCVGKYKNVKK